MDSHVADSAIYQNSRFMKAVRREPVDTTPIWIMRQAGRYLPEYMAVRSKTTFIELCKTPALAAEVTLTAADGTMTTLTTDADGVYTFSDLPLGDYTVTVDPTNIPADKLAGGTTPLSYDETLTEDAPDSVDEDFEIGRALV